MKAKIMFQISILFAFLGLFLVCDCISQETLNLQSRVIIEKQKDGFMGFSIDGIMLLIHNTKQVEFWEVLTGKLNRVTPLNVGKYDSVFLSPDGKTFWGGYKTTRFWDAQTGELKVTIESNEWSGYPVFHPHEGNVATTSKDGRSINLWDLESGQIKMEFTHLAKQPWYSREIHIGPTAHAFTPDGKYLLTTADQIIHVWNVTDGKLVSKLIDPSLTIQRTSWTKYSEASHRNTIYNLVVSKDGQLMGTASRDGTAKLWDLGKRELRATLLRLPRHKVVGVRFSPDGRIIAASSEDRIVRLFNTTTGKLLAILQHRGTAQSIDFRPDGKLLATGADNDHSVKIWDVATGKLLSELKDARYPAKFSPNGKTLATASRKNEVWLWNVPTK